MVINTALIKEIFSEDEMNAKALRESVAYFTYHQEFLQNFRKGNRTETQSVAHEHASKQLDLFPFIFVLDTGRELSQNEFVVISVALKTLLQYHGR